MEYRDFTEKDLPAIVGMWNRECVALNYRPYSGLEDFKAEVMETPGFSPKGCILAFDGNQQLLGFINTMVVQDFFPGQTMENTPGYIHILMVDSRSRRKGIGNELLHRGEEYLKSQGKREVYFSHKCPVKMSWYVDSEKHEHNKAPGIRTDSEGYGFMQRKGYEVVQKEVSYYLELSAYEIPEDVKTQIHRLQAEGIVITDFDEKRNYGYEEMFLRLKDVSFLKKFQDGIKEKKRLLIAEDRDGRVCATAGTIYPEKNGRGVFSALAADPEYGGRGIGQVLFFCLCDQLKQMGAEYMTLFVTSDNFARKIYEKAGFQTVQEWAILRKEL